MRPKTLAQRIAEVRAQRLEEMMEGEKTEPKNRIIIILGFIFFF